MYGTEFKNELLELQKKMDILIQKYVIEPSNHINEIEINYLSIGNTKILIVIPTQYKIKDKLPSNIDKLITPSGNQVKHLNVHSLPVDEAYNSAIKILLEDNADYLFCVEDDHWIEPDTLVRLINILKERNDIHGIGAWYPKRNILREGAHIYINKDKKRAALPKNIGLVEVYTLCQGCSLYKSEIFKYMSYPYFKTTDNLTQDSFFSQKVRQLGYKLYCDTNLYCKHIDRHTGEVYE